MFLQLQPLYIYIVGRSCIDVRSCRLGCRVVVELNFCRFYRRLSGNLASATVLVADGRLYSRDCVSPLKRPGSVWNCLWGHALKRSPGISRKSRVSYPGPGFLSSATWPSLPKNNYNGLINQSTMCVVCFTSCI